MTAEGSGDRKGATRRRFLERATVLAAGAPAAGLLSATSCAEGPKGALGSVRFVFIVKTLNSDYWQACLAGGREAARQFGLDALQFTGASSRRISRAKSSSSKTPSQSGPPSSFSRRRP